MANLCDNHLEFTCKVIPTWFKVDPETSHGISIENEPRCLFLCNDFDSLTCDLQDDGTYWIEFWFETKWAPPENLYASMIADENIISFNAVWYEPGCGVLGYANKDEGVQYDDAPDQYYSDFLDKDVLKSDPPQSYMDIEGDQWITFAQYKVEMEQSMVDALPTTKITIIDEVKEISEYFNS